MTNNLKIIGGIVLTGLVVGLLLINVVPKGQGGVYSQVAQYFYNGLYAGTSNQLSISSAGTLSTTGNLSTTGSLTVGSSGSAITKSIVGQGDIIGGDASLAASTTAPFDIAVTGVVSGDYVSAQLSKAQTGFLGFVIVGSRASTTAGYITVDLTNFSGVAAKPSVSGVASSTTYRISK